MFGSLKKHARLGQWNGRRHSSRSEEGVLAHVWRRAVLVRLLPVVFTVAAVSYLACWFGPPLPYRVGQVWPTDLRVRVYFELVDQPQTDLAREEVVERLPTVTSGDPRSREEARKAVPPIVEKYPRGMLLVPRGQPISDRQLDLLEEEQKAFEKSLTSGDCARRGIAIFFVMSLIATMAVLYVSRLQPALAHDAAKIFMACALILITLSLCLVLCRPPWYAVLVPLTMTAMILTIAYNPPFALLMSFSMGLAVTAALSNDLNYLLLQMSGLAPAVLLLRNVRTRTRIVHVAFVAGLAYAAMTLATGLLTNQTLGFIATDAGRRFVWGSLAGFLLSGSLPLIEKCFGIVTDVSLRELADGSHPLLQELIRRAPGTHTHSVTVATLAEAAAETIGANPLLTRVGSYFHDVGKMLKPHYFIENQTGENRHDELEPALSALVIIGHVKDGLALAEQYHLPRPIRDFIEQHHGTTLVEYFYHEALRLHSEDGSAPESLESSFRYPGPKPQTRETAVVMLADAVESTSRALSEPAPGSLCKLVHDLLMKRLLDGQFEESGLTLTELHVIEQSLAKSLIALFHARIKYPEARARGA